jgi:hypothetical protein
MTIAVLPVHTLVHGSASAQEVLVHAPTESTGPRRDPIAVVAAVLAAAAFAGSFTHVHAVVAGHGQTGWIGYAIAGMPEVTVALVVLKVSRARRTHEPVTWAWTVGTTAACFTVAANLADAEHSVWGYVAAGWPAWSSISALGLMHTGRRAHVHVHASDTPAVHASDTGLSTAVHGPGTVTVRAVRACPDTPVHSRTKASVRASDTASDTPVNEAVHADVELLRAGDVHTLRGAMSAIGCGQSRARRALALAWEGEGRA